MMTYKRYVDIGKRIAAIRNNRGMTEKELGAAIGRTGKTISAYEHGKVGAAMIAHLDDIALALHCNRRDLLAPPEAALPRIKFRAPRRESLNPLRRIFLTAIERMAGGDERLRRRLFLSW